MQRELKEKFDERFLVLKGGDIRDQFGVNQWLEQKQVITSLDLAKRNEILPGLKQVHWNLVIVDEAHRMSAEHKRKSLQPGSARGRPLAGKSLQPGSARGQPLAGKSLQPGSARGRPLTSHMKEPPAGKPRKKEPCRPSPSCRKPPIGCTKEHWRPSSPKCARSAWPKWSASASMWSCP